MNKTLLSAVLIAGFGVAALAPQAANAVDGTITINGTIVSNTCKVGTGSPNNFTVTLPTVSTSAFTAAGNVAGATAFSIAVTGCTSSTKVTTYFEPGTTVDIATGNLINSGTATNVEAQLLNGAGGSLAAFSAIKLGAAAASQNSSQYTLTSGAATLNYYAQYYATGAAVGAGTYASTVNYTMTYQ